MTKKRTGKKRPLNFLSSIGLSVGESGDAVRDLQEFLHRLGYLQLSTEDSTTEFLMFGVPEASQSVFDEATGEALKSYQKFHGLLATGKLDEATSAVMSLPRCGVPDEPNLNLAFVAQGNKWSMTDLTYRIQDFTNDLTQAEIRQATTQAFAFWSEVTSLTFTEVNNNPDILIRFATGNHGDNSPFDGSGSILAHAFYPPPNGGDLVGRQAG